VRIEREDGRVYLSVECECSWEIEHGLQLVFRDGRAISRIGPYDGHLTGDGDAVYGQSFVRSQLSRVNVISSSAPARRYVASAALLSFSVATHMP
jgi:hypothetical protein